MVHEIYPTKLEEERARVLSQVGMLDTPTEERFDRICRMAQQVMQAPATYISLIDRERQWFKSTVGMGELKETPREGTFCDYAIQRSRPTVVLNATLDPLFSRSPYVQSGPQVRFYAGFPLTVDGQRIGTLCALDFEPRSQVTPQQLEQFYDLARLAEAELQRGSDDGLDAGLSQQELVATVLHCSLRDLSPLESLAEEVVTAVLAAYLERCLAVVQRWQGVWEHDSPHAFRVLFTGQDQALMAAGCAVNLQRDLCEWNQWLSTRGLAPLKCSIGLATGPASLTGRTDCQLSGPALEMSQAILSFAAAGQILAAESSVLPLGELAWVGEKLTASILGTQAMTLYELTGVGDLFIVPNQ